MNRKKFLASSTAALAAVCTPVNGLFASPERKISKPIVIPPYLKTGDMIGITAPAGYISREEIIPAATLMQQWGFKIRVGNTIGKKDFTYAGTDEERLQDFQQMLDDPQIKAIMCARGGYGSVRIIDDINWEKFKAKPKWIIGFSDVTVIHSHLNKQLNIASIHSKMCNSFPNVWEAASDLQKDTIVSIKKSLTGEKMQYTAPFSSYNRAGTASGMLVGGNLKTLETLAGSASDIDTHDKILFVEDTGEYLYSIDRMFWNLKRSGKLSHLAGLIIGGIKIKQDSPDEYFGKTIYEIVTEKTKDYDYPVAFDFPVGHQIDNFALKCGIKHKLNIASSGTVLTEE
jgi:muramoyltetrapeptide carboxypeptidase